MTNHESQVTNCCRAPIISLRGDYGQEYICSACRQHDPEATAIEMCPYCKREDDYCNCP